MALNDHDWVGNFCGWFQYRKMFPNEHAGGKVPASYGQVWEHPYS